MLYFYNVFYIHTDGTFCPRTRKYLFGIYYIPELKPFQFFYSCPIISTVLLHPLKQTNVFNLQAFFYRMCRSSEHFHASFFSSVFSVRPIAALLACLLVSHFWLNAFFFSRALWIKLILYPNMLQEKSN